MKWFIASYQGTERALISRNNLKSRSQIILLRQYAFQEALFDSFLPYLTKKYPGRQLWHSKFPSFGFFDTFSVIFFTRANTEVGKHLWRSWRLLNINFLSWWLRSYPWELLICSLESVIMSSCSLLALRNLSCSCKQFSNGQMAIWSTLAAPLSYFNDPMSRSKVLYSAELNRLLEWFALQSWAQSYLRLADPQFHQNMPPKAYTLGQSVSRNSTLNAWCINTNSDGLK